MPAPNGVPKRSSGKGPRPARHVPWPEIFKHHLSVVEAHQKMIETIRQHTSEGTDGWTTISAMVDRCNEMLSMTKKVAQNFVPPLHQHDQVPIGSSFVSVYPSSTPADHDYIEAAAELGQQAAKVRKVGWHLEERAGGPAYERSARSRVMNGKLAERRETERQNRERSQMEKGKASESKAQSENQEQNFEEAEVEEGDNPYFVIDTKPTPLSAMLVPGVAPVSLERAERKEEQKAARKAIRKRDRAEKKIKRRGKRKRATEEAAADAAAAAESTDAAKADDEAEKPTKKSKKSKDAGEQSSASKVLEGTLANGGVVGETSEKKKKKKKKDKKAKGST